MHLASPLLLCQRHYFRRHRQETNDGHGDHGAAKGIIGRPLRDLRAARAARRHVVRAMQGGGEARASRRKRTVRIPAAPVAATDPGLAAGSFERQVPAPRARIAPSASGAGGWGTYATLVAFGVAVCLTGYLALGELEDASNALHDSLAMHAAPAKRAKRRGPAARGHRSRSTNPTRPRWSRGRGSSSCAAEPGVRVRRNAGPCASRAGGQRAASSRIGRGAPSRCRAG